MSDACALGGAIAAVIGHSFPLYFRFRGGKGLAASLGALLLFTPLETFLVLPILGLVYLVITSSAVTGALVSLSLLIGLNLWRGHPLVATLAPLAMLITLGVCSILQAIFDWRQHSDNKNLFRFIGMARTKSKAVERMIAWLCKALPAKVLSLAVAHTDAFQEAGTLERRLLSLFHPEEHFVTELSPVIGAHRGPGLMGVAWWVHAH